ncbi:MAG TPA: HprK-related kinase A [Azoarcus taiwanensis]|nr:HprK-related kinase A [Azoarcus taiwanensis]
MKIRDLSIEGIDARLRADGLRIETGPFIFNIASRARGIAEALHVLYSDFRTYPAEGFSDFHVSVRLAGGLRRLLRPQSIFQLDGITPFKPLPGKQAFAMLEWGMNWCIYTHAHQYLIIHGAALERNGEALVLPAPSGSGKSTLCAALMNRGWRLLSDELILIDPKDLKLRALSRPVSLKNRSIDVLREFAPDAYISTPIRNTSKGTVAHMRPSRDSTERIGEHASLRWVVFPRFEEKAPLRLNAIGKAEMFMALADNAFNYTVMGELGFSALASLVDQASGFRADYGSLEAVITALNDTLEPAP